MHGFNVGGKWLKVTLKKGEEHLLPSNLQAVYQKMSSKIDMQFPSSYQSKENGDSQSTPHMTQSGMGCNFCWSLQRGIQQTTAFVESSLNLVDDDLLIPSPSSWFSDPLQSVSNHKLAS